MASAAGLRLLSVTTYPYPPQHYGGSVMSTHDMCISLMEHGVRPTVLSRLIPTRWPRTAPFAYDVVRVRDPVKHVGKLIATLAPAVAVVQSGDQIGCAEQLTEFGIPTLVYVRDVLFERLSRPYFEHPLVSYVANSAFVAGEVRRRFGIACDVIPPIVRRAAYATESERTHVVFVTPHRFKGVRTMFALARRLPQCKFLVVECWPIGPWERIKLRLEAQRIGNITWCAVTTDMRTIYRRARISGIPVIATDIGGLPESVGPGGILIDPNAGDEEWAQAVERLWSDEGAYDDYVAAARAASARPEVDEHQLTAKLLAKFDTMLALREVTP